MQELENKEQLNNGTVFVEIYSSTCMGCKKQAKIVETIEHSYPSITFLKSNSEGSVGSELCSELNLMQAPTMLIYKDGELIKNFGGLTIPNKLKEILNEVA